MRLLDALSFLNGGWLLLFVVVVALAYVRWEMSQAAEEAADERRGGVS